MLAVKSYSIIGVINTSIIKMIFSRIRLVTRVSEECHTIIQYVSINKYKIYVITLQMEVTLGVVWIGYGKVKD